MLKDDIDQQDHTNFLLLIRPGSQLGYELEAPTRATACPDSNPFPPTLQAEAAESVGCIESECHHLSHSIIDWPYVTPDSLILVLFGSPAWYASIRAFIALVMIEWGGADTNQPPSDDLGCV